MLAVARPASALRTPQCFRFATRQTYPVCQYYSTQNTGKFDAVIIGAGPGGLTCAGNLLDQGLSRIAMIDEKFTAGRINDRYREVPSNTKVTKFEKWATGTNAFKHVLSKAPKGNAYEKLLAMDQDTGCPLGDAVDVALVLSDGLRNDPRITSVKSHVNVLEKSKDAWVLPEVDLETTRVVLAVGSHPRPNALEDKYPHLTSIHLDSALAPSKLKQAVPKGSRVAVVGSSHSAILAIKNLYDLSGVNVVNFYRSELRYAIFKEDWILYDNTGLKGMAADWARTVLAAPDLPSNLRRINLKQEDRSEREVYDAELKDCTHIVSAIGYDINPLPTIKVDGEAVQPDFDPLTGRFFRARGNKEVLPGLFGAGIAYPERVTDREGNVESAVGWFKFQHYLGRVSPEWTQNP